MDVNEIIGSLEKFGQEMTSTGKPVYKAIVDGKTYNWWSEKDAEGFMKKGVKLGTKVKIFYTQKDNPQGAPFKNINSMGTLKDFGIKEEPKAVEDYKEPFNPQRFGLCCKLALDSTDGELDEVKYKEKIRLFWRITGELEEEIKNA